MVQHTGGASHSGRGGAGRQTERSDPTTPTSSSSRKLGLTLRLGNALGCFQSNAPVHTNMAGHISTCHRPSTFHPSNLRQQRTSKCEHRDQDTHQQVSPPRQHPIPPIHHPLWQQRTRQSRNQCAHQHVPVPGCNLVPLHRGAGCSGEIRLEGLEKDAATSDRSCKADY